MLVVSFLFFETQGSSWNCGGYFFDKGLSSSLVGAATRHGVVKCGAILLRENAATWSSWSSRGGDIAVWRSTWWEPIFSRVLQYESKYE